MFQIWLQKYQMMKLIRCIKDANTTLFGRKLKEEQMSYERIKNMLANIHVEMAVKDDIKIDWEEVKD